MSNRGWWSAAVGIALAIGFAVPAFAGQTTFDDSCADVYGKRAAGDLQKTTDPTAGSTVAAGQRVSLTLQWPTYAVAGERANRVMECLSIDGAAPQLWAEKQFTTADGTVSLAAVVPGGVDGHKTACSQSFLKTEGSFGPVTRWSDKTCFPVAKSTSFSALSRIPSPPSEAAPQQPVSRNRTPPTTRGPLFSSPPPSSSSPPPSGRGDYEAPWPPWEKAPRESSAPAPPPVSTTTTLPKSTGGTPQKSQAHQAAAAPPPTTTQAPSQALPRTGAGVVVLIGFAAVALFSGRTLRRTAQHIEDNLPIDAVPVDSAEPTLVLGRRW